jgi:hypothetical protein
MAGTLAKAQRKAAVMARLSNALGVDPVSLHGGGAMGDPELAHIMTLERVADAVEAQLTEDEISAEDMPEATPKRGRPRKSGK